MYINISANTSEKTIFTTVCTMVLLISEDALNPIVKVIFPGVDCFLHVSCAVSSGTPTSLLP